MKTLDIGLNDMWLVRDWAPIIDALHACTSLRGVECDMSDVRDEECDEENFRVNEIAFCEFVEELRLRSIV